MGRLINKYSPLTRQHTSSCTHDFVNCKIRPGMSHIAPAKTNIFMAVIITYVMSHKAYIEELGWCPKEKLRKSLLLSTLSIKSPLSVIVFDIFHRWFPDRCSALSGVGQCNIYNIYHDAVKRLCTFWDTLLCYIVIRVYCVFYWLTLCITVKWCHFENLPDCSTYSNTYFYPLSLY